MMAIEVNPRGAGLSFGTPKPLFLAKLQLTSHLRYTYDVTKDGEWFLLVNQVDSPMLTASIC